MTNRMMRVAARVSHIPRALHQHWQYEPATPRSCTRCRDTYYASKHLPICLKCVGAHRARAFAAESERDQ